MDRTRAQLILAAVLGATAIIGNTLRAREPLDPGPLGLGKVGLSGVTDRYLDETLEPGFDEALQAREVVYRTYDPDADEPVWVFAAYFDRQREGSQVHSPRHCYPGAGWNIERETIWDVPWGTGHLRGLVVRAGMERRLVCYWYQTRERVVPDELKLKVALAAQAVRGRPQEVVFVNVSTPFASDVEAAQRHVEPYARALKTGIDRLFEVRDEPRPGSE